MFTPPALNALSLQSHNYPSLHNLLPAPAQHVRYSHPLRLAFRIPNELTSDEHLISQLMRSTGCHYELAFSAYFAANRDYDTACKLCTIYQQADQQTTSCSASLRVPLGTEHSSHPASGNHRQASKQNQQLLASEIKVHRQ